MKTIYVTENVGQNCVTFDLGRRLYSVIAMRNSISSKGIIGKIDFQGVANITALFFEGFFTEALSNFTEASLKDAFCFNNLTLTQHEMLTGALNKCSGNNKNIKSVNISNNNKAISEILKQLSLLVYNENDKVQDDKEQVESYKINATGNVEEITSSNLDDISDFIYSSEESEQSEPFGVIKIDKISVSDLNRWRHQTDELIKKEHNKVNVERTGLINKLAKDYIQEEDEYKQDLNRVDQIVDIITSQMQDAITVQDVLIIKHKLKDIKF